MPLSPFRGARVGNTCDVSALPPSDSKRDQLFIKLHIGSAAWEPQNFEPSASPTADLAEM